MKWRQQKSATSFSAPLPAFSPRRPPPLAKKIPPIPPHRAPTPSLKKIPPIPPHRVPTPSRKEETLPHPHPIARASPPSPLLSPALLLSPAPPHHASFHPHRRSSGSRRPNHPGGGAPVGRADGDGIPRSPALETTESRACDPPSAGSVIAAATVPDPICRHRPRSSLPPPSSVYPRLGSAAHQSRRHRPHPRPEDPVLLTRTTNAAATLHLLKKATIYQASSTQ